MRAYLVAACLAVCWSMAEASVVAPAKGPPLDPAYRAALLDWQWEGVWSSDCSKPESAQPRLYNVVPGDPAKVPRTAIVGADHVIRPAFVAGAARNPFSGDLWVAVEEDTVTAKVIRDVVWHRTGDQIAPVSSFIMITAKMTIPAGAMPFMLAHDLSPGGTASFFVVEDGFELSRDGKRLGRAPKLIRCAAPRARER